MREVCSQFYWATLLTSINEVATSKPPAIVGKKK